MASDDDATKREVQRSFARETKELTRGALVGRYVVLDRLGEGGMGVVYGAFDPELDRKIAIKLLQSAGHDQAWLVREAQAMARLQHPNVVAVHDVGTLPGDQLFVAMELVDGQTMGAWLRERKRSWREIVPVMRAAGAGLAAAHAAGLVHRDFKPENVLVGKDGRVRVMDFGLARLRRDEEPGDVKPPRASTASESARSPLAAELTEAGYALGTPAYMAPEIYRGHKADARTDQFAFGVTLFEALYGARPFARGELANAQATQPRPKIPADVRVPARLQRIALRAIAIDPQQRYPSIDELLGELARDPGATRRRLWIGGGAGVAVAGAVVATMALAPGHMQVCKGFDRRVARVWNPAARQHAHDAFVATKLPFAETAYREVERAVDSYASEWTADAIGACEATRVRGEQTEDVLSLREACLDRRLDGLSALIDVLGEPGAELVQKGGRVTTLLEPLAGCANVSALKDPQHVPPEMWPQIEGLVHKIDQARAQAIAGNQVAAGALAMEVRRRGEELGYMPVVAQAEIIRGTTLMSAQSFDEAERAFTDAALAAMAGRRDDVLFDGACAVAGVDAQALGKLGEATVWLAMARAAEKRWGPNPAMDHNFDAIEGVLAAQKGDIPAALAAHAKALALAEKDLGHDNPALWEDEHLYATTLTRAFEFDQAARHQERAIALRSQTVGADHPDIALVLSNLGVSYRRLRDPRARATFERAIAIREKAYGKNNPVLAAPVDNYADYLRQEGDFQGAMQAYTRAFKLIAIAPGKQNPAYHQVETDYALGLMALGRLDEARAALEDALALEKATASPAEPVTRTARAELALAQHRWGDAAGDAKLAVTGFETAGGKDNPELIQPLTDLGHASVELGHAADARVALERALAIADKVHYPDADLTATRDMLARASKMSP